jgi:hypothetical protein
MAKSNNYIPEQQKAACSDCREKFIAFIVLPFQGLMVITVKHMEKISTH